VSSRVKRREPLSERIFDRALNAIGLASGSLAVEVETVISQQEIGRFETKLATAIWVARLSRYI
jgi:hypothetical protein